METDCSSNARNNNNKGEKISNSGEGLNIEEDGDSVDFAIADGQKDMYVASNKSSGGCGGFTCCVPLCYNNSKKHKDIRFYVIPKDAQLRAIWLSKISRKGFDPPKDGHRVCSAHFKGERKTYENSIPTIVPKTVKPRESTSRITKNSMGQVVRDALPSTSGAHNDYEGAPASTDDVVMVDMDLIQQVADLQLKVSDLQEENESLKIELAQNKFSIDRFKHNDEHFKFYTGMPSFSVFKAVLNFLEPAASNLLYNNSRGEGKSSSRGLARNFSSEEEFFFGISPTARKFSDRRHGHPFQYVNQQYK